MMTANVETNWEQANQRYLVAALALLKHRLERYAATRNQSREADTDRHNGGLDADGCLHRPSDAARISAYTQREQDARSSQTPIIDEFGSDQQALQEAEAALPAPANLMRLCEIFQLSDFERDVLLLCAGIELDGQLAALCASVQGYPGQKSGEQIDYSASAMCPTFGLALAALPRAHWDALSPDAPLRHWHLIEIDQGNILTASPLHVDEYILHYLAGVPCLDARLAHLMTTPPPRTKEELVPSQRALAERLSALWEHTVSMTSPNWLAPGTTISGRPVVQLCGEDADGQMAIAAAACTTLGLRLRVIAANILPTIPQEIALVIRLWERTAAMGGEVLLLDCRELDLAATAQVNAVTRLIEQVRSPLIVTNRERLVLPGLARSLQLFDVRKPTPAEQRTLWHSSLAPYKLNGLVNQLVAQFQLSASTIQATAASILRMGQDEPGTQLWDACRLQARPQLDGLAQRIEPRADWDDLILPEAQKQLLHVIVAQVRQRATVYETWDFRPGGARGLGISALFAGASGTGKTLAAEVVANTLHLDLYRVDLSSVVSKYVGETEKNLRRVFDAAEEGGVVLLFDEADALFGKRGEVKDSHDRYANIEVSYLLQRMEEYRGLAILTTNFKQALDTAFLRRIRFVVSFPFPDAAQRAEIWRHIFSASLPTSGLDIQQLARLNIAGGNIRTIALNAAFLAAEAGEAVQMKHLLRSAGIEYTKMEKPLTTAEIGDWV